MKHFLSLCLASLLLTSPLLAKAGSSGGTSRSSGSFTSKSSSFGTTASGSASKQTSFSGSAKPATPTTTNTASKPATPSSSSTSSSTSSTASSTPSSSTTIINNTHTADSGPGIGSTILGTAAGAAIGTVVGNSINGNHNTAQPVQTYSQPTPGQYSNQVVVDQPSGYSTTTTKPFSGFSFFGTLFSIIWYLLLFFVGFYIGRKLLYWYKGRKLKNSPIDMQAHVDLFKRQVALLQLSCTRTDTNSQKTLAKITTPAVFTCLSNLASENAERDSINIVRDVDILAATIRSVEMIDDKLYVSVKMTIAMLDFWRNATGKLLSDPGSDTTPTKTTDVYTFVSTDGGKTWLISAIEEYETQEME